MIKPTDMGDFQWWCIQDFIQPVLNELLIVCSAFSSRLHARHAEISEVWGPLIPLTPTS